MKLAIIGIQGSGKSTQAELISKKYSIPYISMGSVLREMGESDTPVGQKIKSYTQSGTLIPNDLVTSIVDTILAQPQYTKGFILDGYPRQLAQAEHINPMIDHVVYVTIPDKEALWRLAHRKDVRDDNTLSAVLNRITIFHESIDPIAQYFREQGKLIEIDGVPTIEEVFKEIEEKLSLLS